MLSCRPVEKIIEERGFIVVDSEIRDGKCLIDFRHPKVRVERPRGYFLSSVTYRPNVLQTTIRSKVDNFKELYLDYCCEKEGMVCRPHVNMPEKILSVEATFRENSLKKFDRLLEEIR